MTEREPRSARAWRLLLLSAFLVAAGGLVYELALATVSTYVLGNQLLHYSVTIGAFLAAMGLGSYLSRLAHGMPAGAFLVLEGLLALVGGSGTLLLVSVQALGGAFYPAFLLVVLVTGALVGAELPLLVRLVRASRPLDLALAEVLGLDYLGSLAGAIVFPLVLLPALDLHRAALAFGAVNLGVGWLGLWVLWDALRRPRNVAAWLACCTAALATVIFAAPRVQGWAEASLYDDTVVLTKTSAHQRIVVTRWRDDVRLFLNGQLQLSSRDAHRYHEALVHPAVSATKGRVRVLILGGGDGLAAREVFRHGERIASLTLVDLDPAVTDLFKEHPLLRRLSGGSLEDRRLRVVNDDAMRFVQEDPGLYEVILVDLPDPDSPDLARLYTPAFYGLLFRRLAPGGVVATQATSAGLTPRAFWCVVRTLEETAKKARSPSPEVRPYHAYVPSFGDWGFVMVGPKGARPAAERLPQGLRYLDAPVMDGLFVFPPDMGRPEVEVNHLHDPVVIGYYRGDYDKTAY